jgi:hypothetical protein
VRRGAAAWLATQTTLVDLAADARIRAFHVRLSRRGNFGEYVTFGTRDGGAFELPCLRISEFDAAGRSQRVDLYDLDQVDQACARFEELTATAAPASG